jgi:hypothetical protein
MLKYQCGGIPLLADALSKVRYAYSLSFLLSIGDTIQKYGWPELLPKVWKTVYSAYAGESANLGAGSPGVSHGKLANYLSPAWWLIHFDDRMPACNSGRSA